jgi:hypothetical protein
MVIIMGYLNPTKKIEDTSHLNFMGGRSYDINDPVLRLKVAAASSFFGEPMYYHRDEEDKRKVKFNPISRLDDRQVEHLRKTLDAKDPREWRGMTPKTLMESAIDAALKHDPIATLELAIQLRHVDNIRVTPQVILVRAAKLLKGTGAIRDYGAGIVKRLDEPAIGLAYQLSEFGKPIPNSLKRLWKDKLEEADAPYLAKYQLENRFVKTKDVIKLVHPKSDAVDIFMKGEVTNDGNTWEAIVSKGGSNTESWTKAVGIMQHMGILRNLSNLVKHKVDPKLYVDKLIGGVAGGRQLPFRYLSAYNAIEKIAPPSVLDALESCMEKAIENVPTFAGRTMSLCDNSGSARNTTTSSMGTMRMSKIANLSAVITGKVSDEGYIGVFGDRLATAAIRKKASIFDQVKDADQAGSKVGQSTENGIWLFWKNAISNKEHWDNVFVYSDMQAGHGGLYGIDPSEYRDYQWFGTRNIDVPKLIAQYRNKVNSNVNVFLVQVAGYQDTIIPEFYNKTYILGGWSAGVLNFAHSMIESNQH